MLNRFTTLRQGLERRLLETPSARYWAHQTVLPRADAHERASDAILNAKPFCAGRIGVTEQKIMLWGLGFSRVAPLGLPWPSWYADTEGGAPLSGVRPRSKASYREFARLSLEHAESLDIIAVWQLAHEYAILRWLRRLPELCMTEDLSPTLPAPKHWVGALSGKRVLVVGPFRTAFENQVLKLDKVWPDRDWRFDIDFRFIRFPYLIDDDCPVTWQEVWKEMSAVVAKADYDVALFGCGGLGLPLAGAAKQAGKVGLHLGGLLQLLFGVYGQRHTEQEWHARCINEHWIRPPREEVPKTSQRVENGCYW